VIRQEALHANLRRVRERIAAAARQAGRNPDEVKLVLVTKSHSANLIEEMLELGITAIGESYLEEARAKQAALAAFPDVEWHMIGHVQSRKAADVATHFDWMHSLGRLKVARKLDAAAQAAGKRLPVLLQVNVSGEDSKFGLPLPAPVAWREWQPELEAILQLAHIEVRGLMSMAPHVGDPAEARPYFDRTRQLADRLRDAYPDQRWSELSMGMSNDFEAAVLEGATLLRIGSAILGPRID
jgi:hypothetical protein